MLEENTNSHEHFHNRHYDAKWIGGLYVPIVTYIITKVHYKRLVEFVIRLQLLFLIVIRYSSKNRK
jgi:hypothetical protein